LLIGNVPN
jgi:hypothetical protein